MEKIENRTFEEIQIGDQCSRKHTVTEKDLILFATVSGDHNPVHLSAEYAATTPFKGQIAHGMFTGALISAALAMDLPGPGTIYLGQNLSFRKPVMLGDELTVVLIVASKHASKPVITLNCTVTNQSDSIVATGEATVMAPTEKIIVEKPELPAITLG